MTIHANAPVVRRSIDYARLLEPSSVAIIGASSNLRLIGGQALRFMLEGGYQGKIYPVNPKYPEMQGLPCYPDVLSVPRPCDVALVVVSGAQVPAVIEQCGKAGIGFAVVLSAGFDEIGERGRELQQQLDAAIAKSGVRVVGPNCVGLANMRTKACCAFGGALADPTLQPGPLAIVSQSGGIGLGMVAHAQAHGIGTTFFVSSGNEADLSALDIIEYLLGRDDVSLVAMYLESYTAGKRLREVGRRALELGKPILIIKVGNNDAARRASETHTGRLTADYQLFKMAFAEGGFIEVFDLDEMADIARLVIGGRYPKGRNIAVTTASGGFGVLLAEQLENRGLKLPMPMPQTAEKLRGLMPSFASVGNPVDQTPIAYKDEYASYNGILAALLEDPGIDAVMVRSGQGVLMEKWAEGFLAIAGKADKPVYVGWSPPGDGHAPVRKRLQDAGFLCVNYSGRGARAIGAFTEFALKRARERVVASRPLIQPALPVGDATGALAEHVSKSVLALYGIGVTGEALLTLDQVRALEASPIPYPVAVKLASPDIPHKTEADGVRLNVRSLTDLKQAAEAVVAGGLKHTPDARIDGVSVQQMASGVEVIVGAVDDPNFGPYVMVGLGGVLTEVLHDVAHRFAPFGRDEALTMIAGLKGAKILDGYRGAPACDVDALADALVRVSWLIADHSRRVTEIDINPLFVRPKGQGVVAADALVVLR